MPPPRSSRIRGTAGRALSDPPGFLVACAYILGKLKTEAYTRSFGIKINRMVRAALRVTFAVVAVVSGAAGACNPKLGAHGYYCECSPTLGCDAVPEVPFERIDAAHYAVVLSARGSQGGDGAVGDSFDGQRLNLTLGAYDASPSQAGAKRTITIDASTTYQTVRGFGNAFTDAAAIHFAAATPKTQDMLLEQYWGATGAGFSVGRVPIGSTDFSLGPWTYDDGPVDMKLERFSIAHDEKLNSAASAGVEEGRFSQTFCVVLGSPGLDDCHEQHYQQPVPPRRSCRPHGPRLRGLPRQIFRSLQVGARRRLLGRDSGERAGGEYGQVAGPSSSPRPSSVTSSRFSALRCARTTPRGILTFSCSTTSEFTWESGPTPYSETPMPPSTSLVWLCTGTRRPRTFTPPALCFGEMDTAHEKYGKPLGKYMFATRGVRGFCRGAKQFIRATGGEPRPTRTTYWAI